MVVRVGVAPYWKKLELRRNLKNLHFKSQMCWKLTPQTAYVVKSVFRYAWNGIMRTFKMTIQVWTGLMHTLKKLQIDRFSTILKFRSMRYKLLKITSCILLKTICILKHFYLPNASKIVLASKICCCIQEEMFEVIVHKYCSINFVVSVFPAPDSPDITHAYK